MKISILLLFAISFSINCFSQNLPKDTIHLMNGELITGEVTDTAAAGVKVKAQKKNRVKDMTIEGERIFSIKFNNGEEKIYYYQDTLVGNYLSIDEAKYFILGEQDAEKYYHARTTFAGGVLVGAASGCLGSLLSFVPPFAYAAGVAVPKIKIKNAVTNPEFLKQDSYIMGYERVAKRKRTLGALYGSLIGLAAGFTAYGLFIR